MKANCEPPLKSSRLSAMVCQKSRPDVTERAPKETPYSPVATLMDRPTRTAGDCRRWEGNVRGMAPLNHSCSLRLYRLQLGQHLRRPVGGDFLNSQPQAQRHVLRRVHRPHPEPAAGTQPAADCAGVLSQIGD